MDSQSQNHGGTILDEVCAVRRLLPATLGRRRANATDFASRGVDTATQLTFALDLHA